MIRPLIINRDYLFEESPGGECLRAFVKAMDLHRWYPIIYASDGFPLISEKSDFTRLVHEKKYIRYIAAAIRRLLIPDLTWLPGYEWNAWGSNAVKQILHDIKEDGTNPTYIHSISYPVASHWVAFQVKKNTGLPWVMQLYDPWSDNPYRPFKTRWLKKKDMEMERMCVETADLIIHDNYNIADIWCKRYGKEIAKKIKVLPLTVPLPKTGVLPISHKNGSLLTISHIGNFMLNRKGLPFINAIANFLHFYPNARNLIKVNFIGRVTEEDRNLIIKNGLEDIFKIHGTLSAVECEKYYKTTDLFLAIDGVNPNNIFFPSKILKYFYFCRPILGITPRGSVLDVELSRAGHAHFSENEQTLIIDFLYRAIYDYDSICKFDFGYWHRFEPSNVIEEYEKMVKQLL